MPVEHPVTISKTAKSDFLAQVYLRRICCPLTKPGGISWELIGFGVDGVHIVVAMI